MYNKIQNRVRNAGPRLAQVMNSTELMALLKEAMLKPMQSIERIASSIADNMNKLFSEADDSGSI